MFELSSYQQKARSKSNDGQIKLNNSSTQVNNLFIIDFKCKLLQLEDQLTQTCIFASKCFLIIGAFSEEWRIENFTVAHLFQHQQEQIGMAKHYNHISQKMCYDNMVNLLSARTIVIYMCTNSAFLIRTWPQTTSSFKWIERVIYHIRLIRLLPNSKNHYWTNAWLFKLGIFKIGTLIDKTC